MKISFLGATRTVTGSFFVIDTGNTRFAVDCGLFQGPKEIKERNYKEFVVDPKSLDFLSVLKILTGLSSKVISLLFAWK